MSQTLMTPETLLNHWQGHRRLTRRVIEAFPEDKLFDYHAPEMRTFGEMVWEIYGNTAYSLTGLVSDNWGEPNWERLPSKKKPELLAAWDTQTQQLEAELPTISPARYSETKRLAWGEMLVFTAIIGTLDNEIHHRSQGYVYLRLLGVEPPAFWER